MKILKPFAIAVLFTLLLTPVFGQSAYKGYPLLKANSSKVSMRIGSTLINGLWTIKPEYKTNTLQIQVTGQSEKVTFYTDIDSAAYQIRPAKSEQFYVLLNKEYYVFTEVKGFKQDAPAAAQSTKKLLDIDKPRSKVFGSLWERHHVGDVVNDINTYADKASSAVSWAKDKLLGSDQ
ncbi:hypothetical protein [uncultured Pontibacter sp.]|uniref:hypothetical protein n=1 Tax=uncultured Pontibacter sp. TaxID=453356 RepID=UPI00262F895E|nr:hypothetical protein [uncultured Pontibacter sp.]